MVTNNFANPNVNDKTAGKDIEIYALSFLSHNVTYCNIY